ncbi:MAG: ComEC/Rec2 family competence protein, partial [Solirubrobacteraceae bacterium]|nr:ComEC/Rec2 family competence protein [Solirubrobacteraceae bacterium]
MTADGSPGATVVRAVEGVRHRWRRRAGVDPGQRGWHPSVVWGAVAVGLAVGPWLDGGLLVAVLAGLLGLAATRPGRAGIIWVAVAAAIVAGGIRADAIDRAVDAPLTKVAEQGGGAEDRWQRLTMREALPAGSRDRSASALAELDGRAVIVSAPRFGAPSPALPRGVVAEFRGTVRALGHDGNDARLRRLGVGLRVLPAELRATAGRRGGPAGAIDRFGEAARGTLDGAVGQRRGALLSGMALGIDEGIGEADQEALRTAGLTHLIAASGGNIALVVALVMATGWLAGVPDRGRLLLSAVAICAYVPLAGSGPSIQRAGVMGLAGLLALALGRERRGADALALAAVATLVLDPRATLDVGWQLSFAAAAALIGFAPPVSRRIRDLGVPRWLAVGLACTVVATVATAPVMLLVFGQLSLIGLVANALVLPLVGVAVWSGSLAAVFTPIAPVVAGWLA